MSERNDDLTGIFDHLSPSDFDLETSAVDTVPGTYSGKKAFDAFAREQLHATRVGFTASDGQLNPLAVLASPSVQRVFVPDDDELLLDFLERVRREARLIGAHWFFFAMTTFSAQLPATHGPTEEAPASDSEEMQRRLRDEADGGQSIIMWYAQAVGPLETARCGIIPFTGTKLHMEDSRDVTQPIESLRNILES